MNFIKKHKNIIASALILGSFIVLGESAIASKPKKVKLVVDTEIQEVETQAKTIEDVLLENNIDLNKIKINKEILDDRIKDGSQIIFDTNKQIRFNNQGTLVTVNTFANTVGEFLEENGINADQDDNITPAKSSKIKNNHQVTYDDIVIENYSEQKDINFEEVKEYTFDLDYGKTEVKVKGENGKRQLNYSKVRKNNELVSDELISDIVLKNAKEQILMVGTKEVIEETIEPEVVKRENSNMYKGESNVISSGSEGKAIVTYKNDGTSREEVERKVITEAKNKIVEVGTKSKPRSYASSSSSLYSLRDLRFRGVINWSGYKFTYYSQSVLPGTRLRIPGRHVNSNGYVADSNGYIVLAANRNIPKGSIINTPFGGAGKVYDTCSNCTINWYDVYTR